MCRGWQSDRGSGRQERPERMGAAALPPLIEAKLAAPGMRGGMVDRPRLWTGPAAGVDEVLTLVAAPAGYGKTTAVRAWCASQDAALAWVTLDTGDNDPTRLWRYVATAVDRVRPGLGRAALQRLGIPGGAIEDAVDELMNGIAAFGERLLLVLDDLHEVTDEGCIASIDRALVASPTQRTRDSRHAGRSCAEPRAIPRRRGARRAAGEGARVHARRDARAPGHPREDRARGGRDRAARRADRGLACDARPGRPLAADGRRPGRGRAGVRRRSPLRGRVPEQRGPRGARRGPAVVSARCRGPARVHRRALRRRARPHRLRRRAGRARALQPPRLAARTWRLVPHPLAVCHVRPDRARIIRAGRRDDDPAPSRRMAQIARTAQGSAPACGGCRRPRVRRRGARRVLPVPDQERRRRDASSLGSHAAG